MPVFVKAKKYLAVSTFALCATLFHAGYLHAASTAATTASTTTDAAAATVSTSADVATPDTPTPDPQAATPTPPAAAPAPAAPAAPPTWSVGPIDFSGLVDGYYAFNANHPTYVGDDAPYGNQLRSFDTTSNGFALSMVKLSMAHSPDPIGFQVDLMFGPAADNNFYDDIEQAYVAWKPTKGKGFEADFGQFVTSAGAEVIESMNNPNYSRSLLFQYLIPLYHVGLRTSMPISKTDTIGLQVVNQWNGYTGGDNNAGKTLGFTNLYTKAKYNWALNYYTGPENYGTDKGFRNLIDTTLNLTPTSKALAKWSAYINYDYVQNRNAAEIGSTGTYKTTTLVHMQGIATEARFQATAKVAFSGRYEFISDRSGLITGVSKASLDEFTLTAERKLAEGLLARVEYRRDATDNPFFVKGQDTGLAKNLVKAQSTLELGVVAFFGPKR